jgi:ParB/RepB/Spo0J family partition protein
MATATAEAHKKAERLRDLKTSARDCLMIDPRIIQIEGSFNPRDYSLPANRQHLEELKANIRENGTRVPLLVRFEPSTGTCVLVDGECRLRCNLELIAEGVEIDAIPTVQVSGGNEAERLITALTANTGKPLSKWESGAAFQRLINFGWDQVKIAKRMGYNVRFVQEAMELADAPQEVKQMLSEQTVTPSLALSELRSNGVQAVETLRAKANQAKASGKKTAKKTKRGAKTVPQMSNNFGFAQALKIMEEVIESAQYSIFSTEFKFVELYRQKVAKIARLLGFGKG